jgi:hypothetical protein
MTSRLADPESASFGELVNKLADDTSRLFHQEAELAKRQLRETLDDTRTELVKLTLGGAVAYAGALALLAGAILLLGMLIPIWLSAMALGGVTAAGGVAMLQRGKSNLKRIEPLPEQTVQRLDRDVQVMKEATR